MAPLAIELQLSCQFICFHNTTKLSGSGNGSMTPISGASTWQNSRRPLSKQLPNSKSTKPEGREKPKFNLDSE